MQQRQKEDATGACHVGPAQQAEEVEEDCGAEQRPSCCKHVPPNRRRRFAQHLCDVALRPCDPLVSYVQLETVEDRAVEDPSRALHPGHVQLCLDLSQLLLQYGVAEEETANLVLGDMSPAACHVVERTLPLAALREHRVHELSYEVHQRLVTLLNGGVHLGRRNDEVRQKRQQRFLERAAQVVGLDAIQNPAVVDLARDHEEAIYERREDDDVTKVPDNACAQLVGKDSHRRREAEEEDRDVGDEAVGLQLVHAMILVRIREGMGYQGAEQHGKREPCLENAVRRRELREHDQNHPQLDEELVPLLLCHLSLAEVRVNAALLLRVNEGDTAKEEAEEDGSRDGLTEVGRWAAGIQDARRCAALDEPDEGPQEERHQAEEQAEALSEPEAERCGPRCNRRAVASAAQQGTEKGRQRPARSVLDRPYQEVRTQDGSRNNPGCQLHRGDENRVQAADASNGARLLEVWKQEDRGNLGHR